MKVNRAWLRAHGRISLHHEDEDTAYEGDFDNPDDVTWIREQLRRGNS